MKLSDHMDPIQPSDIRKWTALIEEKGGVNLAQGMCFIEPLPSLAELMAGVQWAIEKGRTHSGYNTYTDASGVPVLREALAIKAKEFNGIEADPSAIGGNIVVTCGATGAVACAFDALLDPGDEVILFEPFYDYHVKGLRMKLGVPRFVTTSAPDWDFSREDLERAWSPKTRAILVTNPCNPTGKVYSRAELQAILEFAEAKDIAIITDEVYEFITFDGGEHISIASLPGAFDRTITVSAFSKTLAITGWRIGYAIAPKPLAARLKIANEMNYVCAPAPLQHAVGRVAANWRQFMALGALFQGKRDLLLESLSAAGLISSVPRGASYVMTDVSSLGQTDCVAANLHLVERYGIAGVPGSAFFTSDAGRQLIRFCFAHTDASLRRAGVSLSCGEWADRAAGRMSG